MGVEFNKEGTELYSFSFAQWCIKRGCEEKDSQSAIAKYTLKDLIKKW